MDIFAILRLAHIHVHDRVWPTIIAFNASVTSAVVNYWRTTNITAERLWKIAIARKMSGLTAPRRDLDVEWFVAQHFWRTFIKQNWRSGPY